jgi:hypothetical protein
MMTLPLSLFLIAGGAILTWAVDANVSGVNVTVLGVILMVVGIVGLLLTLAFWDRLGVGHGPAAYERYDREVVRRRPYDAYVARPRRRTTVVEDDEAG